MRCFDRLADAIKHFAEKHPEKPGFDREFVKDVGEVPKYWPGFPRAVRPPVSAKEVREIGRRLQSLFQTIMELYR